MWQSGRQFAYNYFGMILIYLGFHFISEDTGSSFKKKVQHEFLFIGWLLVSHNKHGVSARSTFFTNKKKVSASYCAAQTFLQLGPDGYTFPLNPPTSAIFRTLKTISYYNWTCDIMDWIYLGIWNICLFDGLTIQFSSWCHKTLRNCWSLLMPHFIAY